MRGLGMLILLVCVLCADVPARAADPWLQQTLQFQYDLADRMPLRNAPWLGTHNSYNTRAELPTVSGLDANQQLSMAAQLDLGMRSLEIDIQSFPSVFGSGLSDPVVCHARPQEQLNAGCSTERLLGTRLQEVRAWLDAHPDQVLLLYLEDHFDGQAGSDKAAAALEAVLGDKLYNPPAGTCAPMPLDISRRAIRRAGAQVLAISGCGVGSAWQGLVWDDAERAEHEIGPGGFEGYPSCDPDDERDAAFYDAHFVRVYEDSTVVSAVTSRPVRLTEDRTRHVVRCGVDIVGFDQLVDDDPRLAAAAWSWAPGEPSKPGCAVMRAQDARWVIGTCKGRHRLACRTRFGSLTVGGLEPLRQSKRGCAGARFAVPRTGFEAQQLREAMRFGRVKRVWLNHRVR